MSDLVTVEVIRATAAIVGPLLTSIMSLDADHVTAGLIESSGSGVNTKTAVVTT